MTAAVYLLLSVAIIRLSDLSAGMAAFWPSNGVLVYALLVNRRAAWGKVLLGGALASLVGNLMAHNQLFQAALYTLANLVESTLAVGLLRAFKVRRGQLLEPRGMAFLPLAAAIAASISATISLLGHNERFYRAWLSWFGSDLLGMVLVVPAMLVLFSRVEKARHESSTARRLAVFSALALSTGLAFAVSAPLAFYCILPVNYAVYRFGARGAIQAILIVATISIAATLGGYGPFASYTANPVMQIYLLQTFLAALLLAGLPLASLQARQDRALHRLVKVETARRLASEQRKRELELMARRVALTNSRDMLTQVGTRARILDQLSGRLDHLARTGTSVTVAVFDIDHFKRINDVHGHAAGDRVLAQLGQLATQEFLAPHAIGRLGGEEFLAVLTGLDIDQAMRRIERFRMLIGQHFGPDRRDGVNVSVSAGVAEAVAGVTASALLKQADLALLLAKRQGRNRVLLAA